MNKYQIIGLLAVVVLAFAWWMVRRLKEINSENERDTEDAARWQDRMAGKRAIEEFRQGDHFEGAE